MTKWIRWSGLLGFIVVSTLIVCFWMFAAGPLTKLAIEKFGTDALGAKVDVADVEYGLNPLTITVTGVQLTDKDSPMENIMSFEQAVANIEPFPLLLGKAIIPDLALSGVATGTQRSISGAISTPKKAKAPKETDQENSNDASGSKEKVKSEDTLPSADEILERESLLTEQRGEAFKQAYEYHAKTIEDASKNLPSGDAIKQYEKQLDAILKGKFKNIDDFKQRKKQLDELKAQFKQDKQAIAQAKRAFKEGKTDLKQKFKELKSAPSEDLDNIKSKYTLDGDGASNLTALLFGDEAGGYAQTTLEYYEKVRPLLVDEEAREEKAELKAKRLEGRFVHFDTDRPLPDFWIKSMSFTMTLPSISEATGSLGELAFEIVDISHQQDVINRPTLLKGKGINLATIESIVIDGVLDHRTKPGKDSFTLAVNRWQLDKVKLGLAGLIMDFSLTDIGAKADFSAGNMAVNSQIDFHQTLFSSTDRTVLAKEMVLALKTIDAFKVNLNAKGKLSDPKVKINSDLDKQLSIAFDQRIKQKQKELEAKLKDKLNKKLLSYAGEYESKLESLNFSEGNLSEKGDALEKLGKAEISSYEDQLKAEAKAKADAKKAKAKADADKKKKELEKKAKEKLKDLF